MEKKCNECGVVKFLTDFHINRRSSDGRVALCKVCRTKKQRARWAANLEQSRRYGKKYRDANPGKDAAKTKRYRAANPEKCAQYQIAYRAVNGDEMRAKARDKYRQNIDREKLRKVGYYQRCPDQAALRERWRAWAAVNQEWLRAYGKRRTEEHGEKLALNSKRYREAHVEQTRATTKKYRTENRGRLNALYMKRYAQKKNAMPTWADQKAIAAFYTEARERTRTTGIVWHVDHIVPLQHKRVCGLHVEYNLQLLPAKENRVKSNSLAHLAA
jgi:hypothetical protein